MVIINSFKYPESTIRCLKEDVRLILDKKDLGKGTLYVSESTLCWHQRERDNYGLTINYPNISLHAISKDLAVFTGECVYVMVDGQISMPGDPPPENEEDSDNSDMESASDISEILLVPNTTEAISEIYEAIRICQELNPDPLDVDEDSVEEDDNLYEDAEDDMNEEYDNASERGGGDADIDDITRRIRDNLPDVQVNYRNGHNEEDEFQDAD
ncbi:unnamed protein product [Phaedon cochleariae]|uniref:Methylosome subunit pICln n=1 Tax=Phaedon cochleariae TaxID=80249 RepID=A0A9P0DST4_PHACE|nr:unnamed protein product [Phaedon cochleariae]